MTKDDALRSDIRRLGNQLRNSLVRQHGPGLLELVEQVRDLGKSSRRGGHEDSGDELRDLLAKLETAEVIPLVRAFTTYFYLANVSEQVHRIDQLAPDDPGLVSYFLSSTPVGRQPKSGDLTQFDRRPERNDNCNDQAFPQYL